jgi:hypothetical protein
MSRIRIKRPDGTPSPYFWLDTETGEKTARTVYKQTDDGVKRMKGVRFDATRKKIRRD